MPFNISAFKGNGLVYGGARPTLFNVFINTPASLGIANESVKKFTFVCTASELPAFTVDPIDVGYFGRKIKVAGDRTFAPWTVSVLNDEDFSVRSLFEKWSNGINRLVANVRDQNLAEEEYKTDAQVIQYSKDGYEIRGYNLVGVWPMEIGPITLNWDANNEVERFNVTFAMDYAEPNIEDSVKKAGGINVYGPDSLTDGPLGPL